MILYSQTGKERKCLKVNLNGDLQISLKMNSTCQDMMFNVCLYPICGGISCMDYRGLHWVTVRSWCIGFVSLYQFCIWHFLLSPPLHSMGLKKAVRQQHSTKVVLFPRTDTYVDLITPTTPCSCIFALHSMFPKACVFCPIWTLDLSWVQTCHRCSMQDTYLWQAVEATSSWAILIAVLLQNSDCEWTQNFQTINGQKCL